MGKALTGKELLAMALCLGLGLFVGDFFLPDSGTLARFSVRLVFALAGAGVGRLLIEMNRRKNSD
jgi:hypothetical protein